MLSDLWGKFRQKLVNLMCKMNKIKMDVNQLEIDYELSLRGLVHFIDVDLMWKSIRKFFRL